MSLQKGVNGLGLIYNGEFDSGDYSGSQKVRIWSKCLLQARQKLFRICQRETSQAFSDNIPSSFFRTLSVSKEGFPNVFSVDGNVDILLSGNNLQKKNILVRFPPKFYKVKATKNIGVCTTTSFKAWSKRYCFFGCCCISFNKAGKKHCKFPIATEPKE